MLGMLKGFPSTVRRLLKKRSAATSSTAVFVYAFCHWGLPTFIPLFAAARGYNEAVIGLALSANALVTEVSLPMIGGSQTGWGGSHR